MSRALSPSQNRRFGVTPRPLGVEAPPLDLLRTSAAGGAAGDRAAEAARAEDGLCRCLPHRPHPPGPRQRGVRRRGPPEGVGAAALRGHPRREAADPPPDAGSEPAGAAAGRQPPWPQGSRRNHHHRGAPMSCGEPTPPQPTPPATARSPSSSPVDHCALGSHRPPRRQARPTASRHSNPSCRASADTSAAPHPTAARGLRLRHDHGSQIHEPPLPARTRLPRHPRQPRLRPRTRGQRASPNASSRTLKEQLLWVRDFDSVEELNAALQKWLVLYNQQWLAQRHRYRSPAQVRRELKPVRHRRMITPSTMSEKPGAVHGRRSGRPGPSTETVAQSPTAARRFAASSAALRPLRVPPPKPGLCGRCDGRKQFDPASSSSPRRTPTSAASVRPPAHTCPPPLPVRRPPPPLLDPCLGTPLHTENATHPVSISPPNAVSNKTGGQDTRLHPVRNHPHRHLPHRRQTRLPKPQPPRTPPRLTHPKFKRASVFDVHHDGEVVGWARERCTPSDTEAKFVLRVVPADPDDLPAHRKQHGFDNLDFDWEVSGGRVRSDGQCLVAVRLPDYPIIRICAGLVESGRATQPVAGGIRGRAGGPGIPALTGPRVAATGGRRESAGVGSGGKAGADHSESPASRRSVSEYRPQLVDRAIPALLARHSAVMVNGMRVRSLWMKRPAWESVLEEYGNPIVLRDAGRFPHRMAARIAGAIRSALFRGEGGPSPAALRAGSAHEGLSPTACYRSDRGPRFDTRRRWCVADRGSGSGRPPRRSGRRVSGTGGNRCCSTTGRRFLGVPGSREALGVLEAVSHGPASSGPGETSGAGPAWDGRYGWRCFRRWSGNAGDGPRGPFLDRMAAGVAGGRSVGGDPGRAVSFGRRSGARAVRAVPPPRGTANRRRFRARGASTSGKVVSRRSMCSGNPPSPRSSRRRTVPAASPTSDDARSRRRGSSGAVRRDPDPRRSRLRAPGR